MKNMKKLLSLLLIFVLVISIILTGCGGSGTPSSPPAGGSDAADSDAPAEGGRMAYAGTQLNVLLKTGYETEAITRFADDFEAQTGITLNVEVYDEPTLRNKFILDSNSGLGNYDVVATQFWYMPEYIQTGWLESLDSYVSDKSDPEWDSVGYMPDSVLGMFQSQDGQLYSICVSATGGVLIYRKDLFEKHNIPEPKTTADILAAAEILKANEPDTVPFVGRGDSTSGSFGTSAGWAWGYGARVMDESGNVTVDTPQMKAAMDDFVRLMSEYSSPDAAAMGWDTMSEMFRQGKAAMNFEMHGFVSAYSSPEVSSVVGLIDCAVITGPEGNNLQWMYGEGLGISSFSKNKDAAWLFLQWRNSLDVIKKEVEQDIRFDFPDPRIYETDIYREKTADIGFFAEKLPLIMESIDAAYWPATSQFNQVAEAFQRKISLAIAGNIAVDAALAEAQADVEAAA